MKKYIKKCNNINEESINDIKDQYKKIIKEKNKLVFTLKTIKLFKILDFSDVIIKNHIKNIKFINNDVNWEFSYIYHTKKFNLNNYNSVDDSDDNLIIDREKICTVVFGGNISNDNYFIKIKKSKFDRFKIYQNSNAIRIISNEYKNDLDIDEQYELINNYINNSNIPEFLALKFFTYLSDNKWFNREVLLYFKPDVLPTI